MPTKGERLMLLRLFTWAAFIAMLASWHPSMGWPGAVLVGCVGGCVLSDLFNWVKGRKR